MTIEKRNEIFKQLDQVCNEILMTKGPDYANKKDVNANFKRNVDRLGLSKYQTWAIFCSKQFDAIMTAIKNNPINPVCTGEPIEQRIYDLVNYTRILYSLIQDDND